METIIEKDVNLFEELFVKKENESTQKNERVLESVLEKEYVNFLVLILRPKYETQFDILDMFGKTGLEYVKNATSEFETKVIDYDLQDDILKVIKNNLTDKKYVLTLFSDTPLIKKQTVYQIIDYFLIKKLCTLTFNRGYVFDCEYLKSVEKIYNPQSQIFDEEDFVRVFSSESFSQAIEILRRRIVTFHQKSGVVFYNPTEAEIDVDANIDRGVIIQGKVTVLGKSIIKEGCKLIDCKIQNTIVEKNTLIENSLISNSVIFDNSQICDYSVIKNVDIEKNSMISNEKITK